MNDRFVISLGAETIATVELDRPLMRIGRSSDCDIVLPDKGKEVSRHHAVIRQSHHEYKIKNDEGKNGTWVNRTEASDWTVLHRGDVVTVGPYVLRYVFGAGGLDSSDDLDATMVNPGAAANMPPPGMLEQQESLQTTASPTVGQGGTQRDMSIPGSDTQVTLQFIKGPFKGGSQKIHADGFTIGRERMNTVWLNDSTVSGVHAEVFRCVDCWFIKDSGSSNGVSVNGREIVEDTALNSGDRVRVGSSVFIFRAGHRRGSAIQAWQRWMIPIALILGLFLLLAAFGLSLMAVLRRPPPPQRPVAVSTPPVNGQMPPVGAPAPAIDPAVEPAVPVVAPPAVAATPPAQPAASNVVTQTPTSMVAEAVSPPELSEVAPAKPPMTASEPVPTVTDPASPAAEPSVTEVPPPLTAVEPPPAVATLVPAPLAEPTPSNPPVTEPPPPAVAEIAAPPPVVDAPPAFLPIDPAREIIPTEKIIYKSYVE